MTYIRWLFPSFLLDAFKLTGTDKAVLFGRICFVFINKTNKLKLKNNPYKWVAILYISPLEASLRRAVLSYLLYYFNIHECQLSKHGKILTKYRSLHWPVLFLFYAFFVQWSINQRVKKFTHFQAQKVALLNGI